jgi:hypothetical protein
MQVFFTEIFAGCSRFPGLPQLQIGQVDGVFVWAGRHLAAKTSGPKGIGQKVH